MKKRTQRIILSSLLLIVVVMIVLFGYRKLHSSNKQSDDGTVVKENVKVITSDMEENKQPVSVDDDSIVFNSKPEYKKGDVIVSGITNSAPDGYIRKVIEIDKKEDKYVVKTEPAFLTDVFEEVHIDKQIILTEEGGETLTYKPENGSTNLTEMQTYPEACKKAETEGTFKVEVEAKEEGNPVSFSGEAEVDIGVEVKVDIDHGDIDCGVAANIKESVNLELDCGESYSSDSDKLDKVFLDKDLPNYQFFVAGIPIVLTNQLKLAIEPEVNLDGNIGVAYVASSETTSGFQYSSKTGKVKEIRKNNSKSDGLEWNAVSISGDASIGPYIHLITKVYGSSGLDLSLGISGKAEGQAKITTNKDLDGYAGSMDLTIAPEIRGKIVVGVPIFCENLLEQSICRVILKPIWSKHWESSENWEADLEWTETENDTNEQVGSSYSNEYFQVVVPRNWDGYWTVTEEDNSMNGIVGKVYNFSYDPPGDDNGGGGIVYVLDMSDTSRPLSHYSRMIPEYAEEVGMTSFGAYDVFEMEVAAGFFRDGGATITLK